MDDKSIIRGMDRRRFLVIAAGVGAMAATALTAPGAWAAEAGPGAGQGPDKAGGQGGQAGGTITLPPLPYPENGLEPFISAKTIGFHYGKHHQGYVDQTNKLKTGTPFENMDLARIVRETAGKEEYKSLFNNAAQVWNHTFYWNSMKPGGGGKPAGKLAGMIDSSFGGLDKFVQEYVDKATAQFGSGYVWLVADTGGKLKVITTPNAENPLAMGLKPLLTTDVWEHAYYLDVQNRRKDYVAGVVGHLLNWEFAERNLAT